MCKEAWPGDQFVGERAITMTERYQQGRRKSTNTQRQSTAGPSSQMVPDDEENDSD